MPRRLRVLAAANAGAAALALVVVTAQAQAAVVVTQPCVRDLSQLSNIGLQKTMSISGQGFTPSTPSRVNSVRLSYVSEANPTPTFLTSLNSGPDGSFATSTFPASFATSETELQSFALIASDETNPALVATTSFQQVRFSYEQSPRVNRPKKRTHHIARGFVTGQAIYLHLRHGGKTRRTVRLGVAQGPCGIVDKKLRALPTKSRVGKWKFYVDQAKAFSLSTPLQLIASFTVFRTYA